MTTKISNGYVFNPALKQIDFSGVRDFDYSNLRTITHIDTNTIIFGNVLGTTTIPKGGTYNQTTKILTLDFDTTSFTSDVIDIIYNSTSNIVNNVITELTTGYSTKSELEKFFDLIIVDRCTGFYDISGDIDKYLTLSACPFSPNTSITFVSKETFRLPVLLNAKISQQNKLLSSEFKIYFASVNSNTKQIERSTQKNDFTFAGSISITSNVGTVSLISNDLQNDIKPNDRFCIFGADDSRINAGPILVTSVTPSNSDNTIQITFTFPFTITNGTYPTTNAKLRFLDAFDNAINGVGLLFSDVTQTQLALGTKQGVGLSRLQNITIPTSTANQQSTGNNVDSFVPTANIELQVNKDEILFSPKPVDVLTPASNNAKISSIDMFDGEYKLVITQKHNANMSRFLARIKTITKSGSTTATIETYEDHNVAVGNIIRNYGVRDTANFGSSASAVLSVVSPKIFTINIGTAANATNSGGGIAIINFGTSLAGADVTVSLQSMARNNKRFIFTFSGTLGRIPLAGEYWTLYGSGGFGDPVFGLQPDGITSTYDGVYKIYSASGNTVSAFWLDGQTDINGNVKTIPSNDFTSQNTGGTFFVRTANRVHLVKARYHEKILVDLARQDGIVDAQAGLSVNVANTPAVTVSSGSVNVSTVSSSTTTIHNANAIPTAVADVSSTTYTSTTTSATITPTNTIQSFAPNITAITGIWTLSVEVSVDAGTSWRRIFTSTRLALGVNFLGSYNLRGNRLRYVTTLQGGTGSITIVINRLHEPMDTSNLTLPRMYDYTFNIATLNETSDVLLSNTSSKMQMGLNVTAHSVGVNPVVALEGSADGTNYFTLSSITITATGFYETPVVEKSIYTAFRARVTTISATTTIEYVVIGLIQ